MDLLIKDLPNTERPRERLLKHGADALRHAELIAILLRTGTKGRSAVDVAESTLMKYGTLGQLAMARIEDLCSINGVGPDKAIALKSAFTLAKRLNSEVQTVPPLLDSPDKVADLLRDSNREFEVENLQVVLVNTRRRLLRVDSIATGTLDSLLVHPREVFRAAIMANASALVLAHNHPSGDPTPSEADVRVTRDLIRAGQLLKIEVLDHVILGRKTSDRSKDYVSLKELGYFYR